MALQPHLDLESLRSLLADLEERRQRIEALDVPPLLARWLRRITEARGAHMSTRIEGNPMTEQEVREVFARPERRTEVAEIENLNYRDAVQFASQVAGDTSMASGPDAGLIRALHFLILRDVDRYGTAGQYRTKQNAVRHAGETIYLPPSPADVGPLMDDLVTWIAGAGRQGTHPLVVAAVAHAEFINIHPFDDGNGRTGRALTSLLMFRGGWWLRGFVSAEQVFGSDVQAYYSALRAFGAKYPGQQVEFTEWARWFLEGLTRQADARLEEASQQLGREALASVGDTGQRERLATALTYASLFGTVTSREYAAEAGVSAATAVSDLNWLVASGHLKRLGSGRATRYVPRGVPAEA
ncbi:MAG TPA: Fic family protein [Dehalococcoidia bacterium]|nr:Fic family protein [Dehalococcoidia bacterium]